ncbi:DUF2380 domain-containing protein [Pseudaminobacter arsenicus]|uniref:DUF2380 domain-containing protein n=1 Tax=Borborobacter arsenicus TaxID=1851146 RepID=A0A432V608_9HYPH|nr:DUF2380 domain-containing protein [Pseudaminobacter arsenicus]RUM97578.1 DUF2380 domain-containing protein [Pseudaminobacter arsenicus]
MGWHIAPRDQRGHFVGKPIRTLGLLLTACLILPATLSADEQTLALSDFFLVDSSGEARDQRVEHDERLRRMDKTLQAELSRSGSFSLVEMNCPSQGCSGQAMKLDELLGRAQAAGARFLVVGAVEKMSTLVLWSRLEVYEIASRKMVFDRLFTFRGDNDEAWQRAAHYMARDLIRNAPR